ncbi:acetyl-CoA acetyltransferase [Corynebacterium sp. Marseille-P4321]|uniref:acetyl-CoA acetyltransferase n=1 Tax=Corynebacterium sp. Marseille-P4321 TaxID=2736603 RepID=UPI001589A068|nr:acetyl-CoA acetyltransferase [Corynebacterium sp. Marseille-P4321]
MFTQTQTQTEIQTQPPKTAADYNATFNSESEAPIRSRALHRAPQPAAPEYAELPDDLRRIEIDRALPRELRDGARDMSWGLFIATYAPEPTLKVTLEAEEKLNWMLNEYHFDVHAMPKTRAARHRSETVEASGPVRAIGEVLSRHNRYVEILSFHQAEVFGRSLTMLKVGHSERHLRVYWAIGFGATPAESAAAAMSAGAQRVHGNL